MKRNFLKWILAFIITTTTLSVRAQFGGTGGTPGGGGTGGGFPTTGGGPVVPFDGGMSLMLAASGVGYVLKKMKPGGEE